jgi:hypothetical protein
MIDVEIRIRVVDTHSNQMQCMNRSEKMPFPPVVGMMLWLPNDDDDERTVELVAYCFEGLEYTAWINEDDMTGLLDERGKEVALSDRVKELEQMGWVKSGKMVNLDEIRQELFAVAHNAQAALTEGE